MGIKVISFEGGRGGPALRVGKDPAVFQGYLKLCAFMSFAPTLSLRFKVKFSNHV